MTPRAAARRMAALSRAVPEMSIAERVLELKAESLELGEMIVGKRALRNNKGRQISLATAKRRFLECLRAIGKLLSESTP